MLVFLSHSSTDTDAAIALKARIEAAPAAQAAGLRIWLDVDELRPGDQWQLELETALTQADAFIVYIGSKGILNWVDREVRHAIDRATGPQQARFIPILATSALDPDALPPFVRQFQASIDPLGDADALAHLVAALLNAGTARPVMIEHPFVGLTAMGEAQADRFFGRASETAALIETLKHQSLVAVIADSGAGKSSLVRAGLIPAFRGGALLPDEQTTHPPPRHVIVMRPGADPEQGLKDAVHRAARGLGVDDISTLRGLRAMVDLDDPHETHYALACTIDHEAPDILLVVDQFEELLTATSPEDAAKFVAFMLALAEDTRKSVRVVLTVRVDYFNLIRLHEALFTRLEHNGGAAQFRLKRISDAGLEDVVKRPLEMAGHDRPKDRDALAAAIKRDITGRPGDLALVQMALYATWRKVEQTGADLMTAYTQVGGVLGALAFQAEESRAALDAPQQERLLALFARLVRLGDTGGATRRVANLSDMDPPRAALAQSLATEQAGRLLMLGEATVEIAHEALVSQWPWLQSRIQAHADDIRTLARLGDRTASWTLNGATALPPEAEQRAYSDLAARHDDWLSTQERACLSAAKKKARRTKAGYWMVFCALSVSAAISWYQTVALDDALELAVDALAQANESTMVANASTAQARVAAEDARQQAIRAEANAAGGLVALADIAARRSNWESATKLALAAWPRGPDSLGPQLMDAIYTLSEVLPELHAPKDTHPARPTSPSVNTQGQLSPDGAYYVFPSSEGKLALLRSKGNATILETQPYPLGNQFAFSPDGRFFAATSRDRFVSFVDLESRGTAMLRPLPTSYVAAVAFSPDGTTLYAAGADGVVFTLKPENALSESARLKIGAPEDIVALAASPDGRHLAVAKRGLAIEIWDTQRSDIVNSTDFRGREVSGVSFTENGRLLLVELSGGVSTNVVLDTETFKFVTNNAIAQDGSVLEGPFLTAPSTTSANETLFLLNATGLSALSEKDGKIEVIWSKTPRTSSPEILDIGSLTPLAVSADGKTLVTGRTNGIIMRHDAETGAVIAQYEPLDGAIVDIVFTGSDRLAVLSTDPATPVSHMDLTAPPKASWLPGQGKVSNARRLPHDTSHVVVQDSEGTMHVIRVQDGKTIAEIGGRSAWDEAFLTGDTKKLFILATDGGLSAYDLSNTSTLSTPVHFETPLSTEFSRWDHIALSPSGRYLVAAWGHRADGTIIAFDTNLGETVLSAKYQRQSENPRFEFDPAETKVGIRDFGDIVSIRDLGDIAVFSLDGRTVIGNLMGPSDPVDAGIEFVRSLPTLAAANPAVGFSPDQRRFAVLQDGSLHVHDTVTGAALARIPEQMSPIIAFQFPQRDRISVVTADGRVGSWDVSDIAEGDAFDVACALLPDTDVSEAIRGYPIVISEPICMDGYAPPSPDWMTEAHKIIGFTP